MRTRLATVILALAAVTGAVALAGGPSAAQTPAPPTTGVPPTLAPPLDGANQEVVHSWALGPAGSLDPNEAGNRPNLSYTADPGAVIQDAVTLSNYGNVALTFRVYATDAFNQDNGDLDILPGTEPPTDVGSWVKVDQDYVTVLPAQQVTMPITITVPADADPGDHVGAVVASSEAVGGNDTGQAVILDRRTGTVLFLRVNGPVTPELVIESVQTGYGQSVNPLGGTADVTYRIANRGNVRLGGTATISVAGPLGLLERRLAARTLPELLPGESMTITDEVASVPALGLLSTTVRLEPTSPDGTTTAAPSSRKASTLAPPVALGLLLLIGAFAVLAVRSVRRHRHRPPPSAAAPPREREALHS